MEHGLGSQPCTSTTTPATWSREKDTMRGSRCLRSVSLPVTWEAQQAGDTQTARREVLPPRRQLGRERPVAELRGRDRQAVAVSLLLLEQQPELRADQRLEPLRQGRSSMQATSSSSSVHEAAATASTSGAGAKVQTRPRHRLAPPPGSTRKRRGAECTARPQGLIQ
ncbi:hypothetical protein MUK42_23212 [Musa troglodytarum]|uniref:Uncharacterized protein n=1 Tax=Musa troglodytarum TaxID=320322 RepID=A0A9E7KBT6_9LILI|nr:hypothetical protein MUK42_23212 [Musa troglodytarum]